MPTREKIAARLIQLRFPRSPGKDDSDTKPQKVPRGPAYFNIEQRAAWRDICRPICARRLWADHLATWAETFALLLAEARGAANDDEKKPNRAQLRLYTNDLRFLIGKAGPPAAKNPFSEF